MGIPELNLQLASTGGLDTAIFSGQTAIFSGQTAIFGIPFFLLKKYLFEMSPECLYFGRGPMKVESFRLEATPVCVNAHTTRYNI